MSERLFDTFCSYSREDSPFVLRLVKDLKAAGGGVWLDQLDIGPGKRWDSAVEQALRDCPTQLAILSPAGVNSVNVMDEISYALEQGKKVIPVFYRECEIPFRLRRLHYADFRAEYERGLNELLAALGLESQRKAAQNGEGPGAAPAKSPAPIMAQADRAAMATSQQEPSQKSQRTPSRVEAVPREMASVKPTLPAKVLTAVVAVIGLGTGAWYVVTRDHTAPAPPTNDKNPPRGTSASTQRVLWRNQKTGELSTWPVDREGNVSNPQAILKCGSGGDPLCSDTYVGVGNSSPDGGFRAVSYNVQSGRVNVTAFNAKGVASGPRPLSWACNLEDCGKQWKPIGVLDLKHDGNTDVLWFNKKTGEYSVWLVDRVASVVGKTSLQPPCGDQFSARCADLEFIGTGDFTGNATTSDLFWHDTVNGVISVSTVDRDGWVLKTSDLSWQCAAACSKEWKAVGVGRFSKNGIGDNSRRDILWHRIATGELSAWVTDKKGVVTEALPLSKSCEEKTGCSKDSWTPVAMVL